MSDPIPPRSATGSASTSRPHSPTAARMAEMAEAIGRETDGAFELDVFPESRLGPDPQMFADVQAGELEFFVSGATLGGIAPSSALPLLPFAFKDSTRGLRRARRRARRRHPRRAGAGRPARLPPFPAERLSPHHHQHAADRNRRRFRRAENPQPGRRDRRRFLRRPSAPRPAWCRSATCTTR